MQAWTGQENSQWLVDWPGGSNTKLDGTTQGSYSPSLLWDNNSGWDSNQSTPEDTRKNKKTQLENDS